MSSTKLGLIYATGTALCWAVLAIILKFALNYTDSGSIVWIRMIVAFAVLSGFMAIKSPSSLKILRRPPKILIVAALCLAFNYFAYMKSVELTTASNTQIMIQLGPLLLAVTGLVYFKEIPSLIRWFGFGLATLGFVFFYFDQIVFSISNKEQFIAGNIWVVGAAISWTVFAFIQKIWSQTSDPQETNLLIYGISTIVLFFLADLSSLSKMPWQGWTVLVFLGLNTLFAYGCLGEALKRAPASMVSLIITLNPLVTIFIIQSLDGFNLLFIPYEPLTWKGYIGATLVVVGVSLTLVPQKKQA